MMASLQQAMSKGMPPDQAIQYVKSMATQGVAPMADLYAMMNQFQRLKQQPAQAPQTPPTIRDQLNMAEQQQAQQQMAMQQGLGGMPAPAMEQAQFAGGGIVAFDEGGPTDSSVRNFFIKQKAIEFVKKGQDKEAILLLRSEGIDPQEVLGDRINILDPAGPRTPADQRTRDFRLPANLGLEGVGFDKSVVKPEPFGVTPPSSSSTSQGLGAIDPRRKTTSRGSVQAARPDAFTEALKRVEGLKFDQAPDTYSGAEEARIKKDMASLGEERQQSRQMALAQAGFGMAAAASRRGRDRTSFLGALSEGAMGGMKQYNEAQRELRGIERELNKQMSSLAQYRDQVATNNIKGNREFETSKINAINELSTEKYKLEQQAILERAKIAAMQERGSDKPEDILDVLRREYAMQVRNNDPQAAATKKLLDELVKTTTGVATAMQYANKPSGGPGMLGIPAMPVGGDMSQWGNLSVRNTGE
jgi:hypothetical protein